jgi:hypothetical protein
VKDPKKTGTEFTTATTENSNAENGAPNLPLMSEAGKKLASKTAPQKATDAKITRYPGNTLHDSMLPIFRRL